MTPSDDQTVDAVDAADCVDTEVDAAPGAAQEETGTERSVEKMDIAELRKEIDWLDAEILRLIKRRTEVSRTIGATRMAAGGTRIVVNREMDVIARFRDLGPEGRQLAMLLLNLGRGRLGR
ncbi:MAG TPA: chorismate mutase [Pseudonocardiaceae bacterium]|nr:chorismate mutase [Pseudonocardiaceae bacterium]